MASNYTKKRVDSCSFFFLFILIFRWPVAYMRAMESALLSEKKSSKAEALQFFQSLFLENKILSHKYLSRFIARMIIREEAVAFIFKIVSSAKRVILDDSLKPIPLRDTPFFAMAARNFKARQSLGIWSLDSGDCAQKINQYRGKEYPHRATKTKVDRSGELIATFSEDGYAYVKLAKKL